MIMPTKGSILIPAHNEAAVIARCLDALFEDVCPGELEAVVVCNGCSDDTARVVRDSEHDVMVLESDVPSKPEALRMGERVLKAFPRLYLDADVILRGRSALALCERLRQGPALAARPPILYEVDGASGPVRRYYKARERLTADIVSLWGAGIYGLSQEGRARFGAYPDIVGEDLFVDSQFAEHEVEVVCSAPVIVRAPRRTADLVRIIGAPTGAMQSLPWVHTDRLRRRPPDGRVVNYSTWLVRDRARPSMPSSIRRLRLRDG